MKLMWIGAGLMVGSSVAAVVLALVCPEFSYVWFPIAVCVAIVGFGCMAIWDGRRQFPDTRPFG